MSISKRTNVALADNPMYVTERNLFAFPATRIDRLNVKRSVQSHTNIKQSVIEKFWLICTMDGAFGPLPKSTDNITRGIRQKLHRRLLV